MLLTGAVRSRASAAKPTRLNHGRFKNVVIYTTPQAPTSFALLLSGDGGWGADGGFLGEGAGGPGRHGGRDRHARSSRPRFRIDGCALRVPRWRSGELEPLRPGVFSQRHLSFPLAAGRCRRSQPRLRSAGTGTEGHLCRRVDLGVLSHASSRQSAVQGFGTGIRARSAGVTASICCRSNP